MGEITEKVMVTGLMIFMVGIALGLLSGPLQLAFQEQERALGLKSVERDLYLDALNFNKTLHEFQTPYSKNTNVDLSYPAIWDIELLFHNYSGQGALFLQITYNNSYYFLTLALEIQYPVLYEISYISLPDTPISSISLLRTNNSIHILEGGASY